MSKKTRDGELEFLFKQGLVHARQNAFVKALNDFTKYIDISADNDDVFYNRGIVKEELKDYQGAIEDYDKAIRINENNIDSHWNLAILKSNLESYEEALYHFNLIFQRTQDRSVILNIVKTKNILKDFHGALIDIDLFLNNSNSNQMDLAQGHFYKYCALIGLDKKNEAICSIQNAIHYDDQNSLYYLFRGSLYLEKGTKIEAKKDFILAIENTTDKELIRDLSKLLIKCD